MASEKSGSAGAMYFDIGLNWEDLTGQLEDLQDQMGSAMNGDPVDKLNGKIDDTVDTTKKLNKELKGAKNGMDDAADGAENFASAAESVGKALAAAFEIKMIIDFSKACLDATNTQQTAEVKLVSTMRQRMNATKEEIQSVKDLASEMQKVGVVGDEVTLAGAAQLATFTDSIEAMETILPEMADVAAAVSNGEAVTADKMIDAAKKFGKAMSTGSLSELEEYGIVVTNAELASWERLTDEEEKAAYLADLVNSRIGNMNEVMRGQFNGAFSNLMNDMGDVMEKWGRILQVGLLPAINLLDKIVVKFGEFSDKIMEFFGIEMLDDSSNSLVAGSEIISDNMATATEEAKELQKALLGFDKAYVLPDQNKETSSNAGSTYNYYTTNNNNSSRNNITTATTTDTAEDGEKSYGERLWNTATEVADAAGNAFDRACETIRDKIADTAFVEWWMEKVDPTWMKFKDYLKTDFIGDFVTNIEECGDTVVRMLEDPTYWTEIGEAFGEVFEWLGNEIGGKVSSFFDGIQEWWDRKTGQNRAKGNRDKRAQDGDIETNSGYERSLGQKIWDTVTWWPHFAEGGFVQANTPTLAVIGDNRTQGEYVLPENKLKALMQGAGSSQDTAVLNEILQAVKSMRLTANVDANSLARLVVKIIRDEERSTGRSLI